MSRVAGKNVLVTGASSGIGAALAPLLAQRGATVGVVARRRDRLAGVLASCRRHAPDSRMWVADLGELETAEAVAIEAWSAFGHVDVLVNNAGMGKRKHVRDLTAQDLERVMAVNFFAPVRMGQALLPLMMERNEGLVVNVSSTGGRLGIVHEAAYCAAKFALCGWSEAMHIDLLSVGGGVDVKLVMPGPIETEIWETPSGELDSLYTGERMPAADCASGIAAAIEADGFEFYVPDMREVVKYKTADTDGFLRAMAEMSRTGELAP